MRCVMKFWISFILKISLWFFLCMNKIEFGMSCIVVIYGFEFCLEGCDVLVCFVGRNIEWVFYMNVRLYGFWVIDIVKYCLEKVCFRIELCVDFLVYVFCNVVVLIGGKCW